MPSEQSSDVKFEIGHVLFIDIVGYSKLLINEQSEQIQRLRRSLSRKSGLEQTSSRITRAIYELPIAPAENRFNEP
jgi:hypothetical protein